MKPVARTDRLIKQAVGEDILVYDQSDDTACALNTLAMTVWRHCDGEHSVEEIAEFVSAEVDLPEGLEPLDATWCALDELKAHNLLTSVVDEGWEAAAGGVPRRDAVKALAGLAIFPTIQQITAPIVGTAASPDPTPTPTMSGPPPSMSQTPMVTPTSTPTPMVTPTSTPTPMVTPTSTPTPTVTVTPSQTPSGP